MEMSNPRVLNRLVLYALTAGLLYFSFCIYLAVKRMEVDDWNDRKSLLNAEMRVNDPGLQEVHKHMISGDRVMSAEVTVVTAYFNIGNLNKGGPFGVYTPQKYIRWMSVFGRLNNPLIVFTDSIDIRETFKRLREKFPKERTQIYVIERTDLWAFSLAPEIKTVFSQPDYPNFDPNTVHENYSCTMHAKFELVHKVIRERLFRTQYLAWLDIGLFRAVVNERHLFPLRVPADFDVSKVAYSRQAQFEPSLTPMQVIGSNKVWVAGATFLGRPDVLYVYTQDYMRAVRKMLDMKIMSTDQQVIYIMYLPTFDFHPRVEIQTYTTHSEDDWFYLGYVMKDIWERGVRRAKPVVHFLFSFMT